MPPAHTEHAPLLPGLKPVLEMLERDPSLVHMVYIRKGQVSAESSRLIDLCREYGVRFALVGGDSLARMAKGASHQGVVAQLREVPLLSWEEFLAQAHAAPLPLIVALDEVQDPGNVGTLARTIFAMGGAGLVLTRHNSAMLGPGARRAAAGALERLPLTQVVNLSRATAAAQNAGFTTCAAQRGEHSLNALLCDLPLPAFLVLGNENRGVRPGVRRHCEISLALPFLRDFDSLNVAQAGGMLIACFARSLHLHN